MRLWVKKIEGTETFWGIHSDDQETPHGVTAYPTFENIYPMDIEKPVIWAELMRVYPTLNTALISFAKEQVLTYPVAGDLYIVLTSLNNIEVRRTWRHQIVSTTHYRWLGLVSACYIGVSGEYKVMTPTGEEQCTDIMHSLFSELFNECPVCGRVRNYVDDGPCDICIQTHGQCSSCGAYFPLSDLANTRRGFLCRDCNVVSRDDVIDGYGHTRGDLPFFPERMPKVRYYGVEFEFSGDCTDNGLWEAVDTFTRKNRYGEAKEDGSLSGDGFELVTYPATFKHLHSDVFGLQALLKKVNASGFRRVSETGMHIHVSRASLGKEAVDKLAAILNNCQSDIIDISDRGAVSSWAKFDYDSSCRDSYAIGKCRNKDDADDRYSALNCTNSATVEFRFFRGTKSFDKFIRRLVFIDCLLDYIDNHTFSECFAVETLAEVCTGNDEAMRFLAEYNIQ